MQTGEAAEQGVADRPPFARRLNAIAFAKSGTTPDDRSEHGII